MRKIRIVIIFSLIVLLFSSVRCEKEKHGINITLHDKPLPIIQSYINGKWKLQYGFGGFIANKSIDTMNSYVDLSSNRIIFGNKTNGVILDTTIIWVRNKDVFNDSTYLLSYRWSGYLWPEYKIIDQIKNDTLIIIDDTTEPIYYYYTKY